MITPDARQASVQPGTHQTSRCIPTSGKMILARVTSSTVADLFAVLASENERLGIYGVESWTTPSRCSHLT